ncbi:MAG: HEAT repeat domain-containing protein [Phycisphaerae bacterium]
MTSPTNTTADPSGEVAYEESAPAPRREAGVLAVSRRGRRSVTLLREIARQDSEPTVRAAAIAALGEHYDYRSMDLLLEALESPTSIDRSGIGGGKAPGRPAGQHLRRRPGRPGLHCRVQPALRHQLQRRAPQRPRDLQPLRHAHWGPDDQGQRPPPRRADQHRDLRRPRRDPRPDFRRPAHAPVPAGPPQPLT